MCLSVADGPAANPGLQATLISRGLALFSTTRNAAPLPRPQDDDHGGSRPMISILVPGHPYCEAAGRPKRMGQVGRAALSPDDHVHAARPQYRAKVDECGALPQVFGPDFSWLPRIMWAEPAFHPSGLQTGAANIAKSPKWWRQPVDFTRQLRAHAVFPLRHRPAGFSKSTRYLVQENNLVVVTKPLTSRSLVELL